MAILKAIACAVIKAPRATLDPKWQPANARVQALVACHPNAQWIDISDSPMFATLPFYEGQLIYADAHHLNELGARAYGAALRNALSQ